MGFFSGLLGGVKDIVGGVSGALGIGSDALFTGGLGLLGGLLGNSSREDANNANIANAQLLNRMNYEQQKEFAQHGIRWKVEDAKAAGLHPLHAIGASTASYSPSMAIADVQPTSAASAGIGGFLANSGQQNSRSALSDEQKLEQQLRIAELSSRVKKDDAIAAYYDSLAGTERQKQMWGSIPYSTGSPAIGGIEYKKDEVVSADPSNPSLTAGKHPAMTRYNIGGTNIELPYSSEGPAESLENPALFPFIAGYNAMRMVPESVWDNLVENKKRSYANRLRTPPARRTTTQRLNQPW